MKNFLTSPVSNSVLIASAILFALLSWLGGGAGSDVTGLAIGGTGATSNFDNVAATNITATGAISTASLRVAGYSASGAVRFGSASVISGTTIAHGFGTTPTSFIVQNSIIRALVYTQSLYAGGCDVTSCTVYFTQGSITTTTASWIAGR